MLEHAGDVALGRAVGLRRARQLDRQRVLGAGAELVGDLERVGGEVALGVAEVGAVEPDVALVEEAVEAQPPPAVAGAGGLVEGRAVQQRAVVVGEGRASTASGRAR